MNARMLLIALELVCVMCITLITRTRLENDFLAGLKRPCLKDYLNKSMFLQTPMYV